MTNLLSATHFCVQGLHACHFCWTEKLPLPVRTPLVATTAAATATATAASVATVSFAFAYLALKMSPCPLYTPGCQGQM